MKPKPDAMVESRRIAGPAGENSGAFQLEPLRIVCSDGMGWDHVSVSRQDRCPTWEEMEMVKRRFFKPTEAVMQLHVPESDHINMHEYCLHLWRPQSNEELAIVRTTWGDEWPAAYPDKSPGMIPIPPAMLV